MTWKYLKTVHAMDKTEAFRLVVTRKKKMHKEPSLFGKYYYEYYGIATNSNLSKEKVFHFYNERGKCEYYIKSVKWDLSLRNRKDMLFYPRVLLTVMPYGPIYL